MLTNEIDVVAVTAKWPRSCDFCDEMTPANKSRILIAGYGACVRCAAEIAKKVTDVLTSIEC